MKLGTKMTQLVDHWVLEWDDGQKQRHVDEGERQALWLKQEALAARGLPSQLYHERHVLIREPIRWLGKREPGSRGLLS
jgi:hypothetical protein